MRDAQTVIDAAREVLFWPDDDRCYDRLEFALDVFDAAHKEQT